MAFNSIRKGITLVQIDRRDTVENGVENLNHNSALRRQSDCVFQSQLSYNTYEVNMLFKIQVSSKYIEFSCEIVLVQITQIAETNKYKMTTSTIRVIISVS